jgi:hypothetical protein
VVAIAGLLRAQGSVDLPLLMLAGLAKHGQQDDPSGSSSNPYSSLADRRSGYGLGTTLFLRRA